MVVTMIARTDTRKTGLGKYIYSLYDTLHSLNYPVTLTPPVSPPLPHMLYSLVKKAGRDLHTFFQNYPVWMSPSQTQPPDVYHITSQNLALLLRVQKLGPTVATVHDLYYLVDKTIPKSRVSIWSDRFAAEGLKKADALIAISEATKKTILELIGYPAERITVIPRAVDTGFFKPMPVPADFRTRYELPPDAPLVLFLGSEDPRKNLATLLQAFQQVHEQVPDAILVKAGAIHFHQEAARLQQMTRDLGLSSQVHFITGLPDEDLPLLYNTADVVVMPSFFEGFGLPALEAMACGRAVVASNASSLPEVVGEAGVLFDPHQADELAAVLTSLLHNPDRRRDLGQKALTQAHTFSLVRQATQTWEVYQQVYAEKGMAPQA